MDARIIAKAARFAEERHQRQKYGQFPYITHLQQVADILREFGYGDNILLLCAAWLHDIVEDTSTTIEEVETLFGPHVAALVYAVTDAPGHNRATRQSRTYPKIRSTPEAVVLKQADRIANVRSSKRFENTKIIEMYTREWPSFRSAFFPAGDARMWKVLDGLFS